MTLENYDIAMIRLKSLYEFFDAGSVRLFVRDLDRIVEKEAQYRKEVLGKQMTKADHQELIKETYSEAVNQFYERTLEIMKSNEHIISMVYEAAPIEIIEQHIKEKYER